MALTDKELEIALEGTHFGDSRYGTSLDNM